MILNCLLAFELGAKPQILFVGNSHTAVNNVPEMVRQLLMSDSMHRKPNIRYVGVSLLEAAGPEVEQAIRSQHWDAVVLQGAQVSSSHKYRYKQDKAIRLSKLAVSVKARVLLCAEWPRRGWDESDYQLGVYREIQKAASGSEIVPICKVWDASRKQLNGIDMWQGDGNHATLEGSFLSACTIYRFLVRDAKDMPSWQPDGVSARDAKVFHSHAKQILAHWK